MYEKARIWKKIKEMKLDKLFYQDRKLELSKGIYEENDKKVYMDAIFMEKNM